MSERKDFQPLPRDTSLLDICGVAFEKGLNGEEGFDLTTEEVTAGIVDEMVSYTTPYGESEVSVTMRRPTLDTAELLALGDGSVDEKPRADIWVNAPRGFLFRLMNGEKYYAGGGFFRVIILSDGPHLDIFTQAFATKTDDDGNVTTAPVTVGSLLRPLPQETDWEIQEVIEPK